MALIPEGDPTPTPSPTPAPTPTPTPAPAPSGDDPPPADDKPEWVPEGFWKEGKFDTEAFEALTKRPEAHTDVPDAPENYVLPAIEGFDAEKAADSPLFKALMKGAHANGLGQAAFEGVVKDYIEGEVARVTEFETAETAKLGENAKQRLSALGNWLAGAVTAEQAAALRAALTTADGVAGLEALMNAKVDATHRENPPPPVPKDTREAIEALMKSPAYRGKPSERDPAVIKRVEDFFAAEAAAKKAGKTA